MVTLLIIIGFLLILIIGFVFVFKRHSVVIEKYVFTNEYRNKFNEFSVKYFENNSGWGFKGNIDNELYVWLTKNVNKVQNYVGVFGLMSFKPALRNFYINNYQIIINTIPKFRDGKVETFDVNAFDDCLLRYIGFLEEQKNEIRKQVKNPIIWFRDGCREIISIPFSILFWFGIISNKSVLYIKESWFYKVISGIFALLTLVSGLVTIIIGYDQTVEFVNRLLGK